MERIRGVATLASAHPPLNLFEQKAVCRWLVTGSIDEISRFAGDDLRNLDALMDVMGWRLDPNGLVEIGDSIRATVRDPVDPEFIAPPEQQAA